MCRLTYRVCALALFISHQVSVTVAQESCFENPDFNEFFATDDPTCCQNDVCAIPCPEPVHRPTNGFAICVLLGIVFSFLIGFATLFFQEGEADNFFVAGRSLPLWIVAMTLGAQSIDSNAILGNADLSYKYHFYDGAVLPIGLGLSLLLNAAFLARHINKEEGILTLPDIHGKRYGKLTEIFITSACILSFMMLLAGNLVGMGNILSYVLDVPLTGAIWTTSFIIWAYTISGGLFSVAYTDVAQGIVGWSGCIVCVFYLIANEEIRAPPPSIGLPGYIYPDGIGDGGICDMYEGVSCVNDDTLCCYNEELWCPSSFNCRADNGAYPIGDQPIFQNQMGDFLALSPFPNNIFYNWATIFILGFGNLAALDFQARCMAAKTPKIATLGCIIGGLVTFFVGVPFAYMGALSRVYYGPDSVHAVFAADTCNPLLGLPTCAAWQPDPLAFLKLLTHQAPLFLGGWCLIGIVTASMSTADGAILAMGTCFAHNIMRQLNPWFPGLINNNNLVSMARLSSIPLTVASTLIATRSPGSTGYLLIVAFDVVLATAVVPLFGCFYTKTPRPNAAFLSCISGASMRITLEFTLPKDGFLLLPYNVPEFQDYGPAASTLLPSWIDAPKNETWNPDEQVCDQPQLKDFTGVDSLAAFLTAILVFCLVQTLEHHLDRPLFFLPGLEPYEKDYGDKPSSEEVRTTRVLDLSGPKPTDDVESTSHADQTGSEDKQSNGSISDVKAVPTSSLPQVLVSASSQDSSQENTAKKYPRQEVAEGDSVLQGRDSDSTVRDREGTYSMSDVSHESPLNVNALLSKYDSVADYLTAQNGQLKMAASSGESPEQVDEGGSNDTSEVLNKVSELLAQRAEALDRYKNSEVSTSSTSTPQNGDRQQNDESKVMDSQSQTKNPSL